MEIPRSRAVHWTVPASARRGSSLGQAEFGHSRGVSSSVQAPLGVRVKASQCHSPPTAIRQSWVGGLIIALPVRRGYSLERAGFGLSKEASFSMRVPQFLRNKGPRFLFPATAIRRL